VPAVLIFRDEALDAEPAGLLEDLIGISGQMITEHDRRLGILEQRLQPFLTLEQRQIAEVLALGKQQIEGDEAQGSILAFRERVLKERELAVALLVEDDDFAIDESMKIELGES